MKQPLPQDQRILEALGRFHVLSAELVRRLFFGKSLFYVCHTNGASATLLAC
jgi:hypothetical protein